MSTQKNNVDLTHIIERVAVTEEKTKAHSKVIGYHGTKLAQLEEAHNEQTEILGSHATELKIQKLTLESKFDAVIKQSESLEKSIISLREVVDKIVPVLYDMISSKKGADKAKARIAKIILSTIAAGGTIVGGSIAILKYLSN